LVIRHVYPDLLDLIFVYIMVQQKAPVEVQSGYVVGEQATKAHHKVEGLQRRQRSQVFQRSVHQLIQPRKLEVGKAGQLCDSGKTSRADDRAA
jgi:hypothetical protein